MSEAARRAVEKRATDAMTCHPERSEGSVGPRHGALRSREHALVRRAKRFLGDCRLDAE